MPASDLAQRIAKLKAAAEKARDAYPNVAWLTVADLQRSRVALSVVCSEHIAQASPDHIFALIAELDRQGREIAGLKRVVNAAVTWRREGYERKAEFTVGISPLLDAIDIYDVGQRRASTEYTGEDD